MKKSILFVDDEISVLDSIRRILHSTQNVWNIEYANSVSEAKILISNSKFDVLVLDVNMPDKSGLDLLIELKGEKKEPEFEIIMLTGLDDQGLKRKSLDLGATDLITKPVSKEDLIARLESVISMKSYRDDLRRRTVELENEIELRKNTEERLHKALDELKSMNKRLEELSIRDPLTEIYNRRYFTAKLAEYSELSHRLNQPLSCTISDIDHFKRVNDNHGHQAGDYVLKKVATVLSRAVRKSDIVARYGGEEFIMLLPNTNIYAAMMLAEKLRSAIESTQYSYKGDEINVTISIGVSVGNVQKNLSEQLVNTADQALYIAKNSGRNRVCKAPKEIVLN